jgi:hypothetical protein
MNRRSFLGGLGTVSVLAVGGLAYRAIDTGVFQIGQGPDFEPWSNWQSESVSGPLRLIRAGILAANPHNSQPWLFQVGNGSVSLFADRSRHLGAMDPYLREMYLGLGCALENMVIAARAEGYACQVQVSDGLLPGDQPMGFTKPVATIYLTPQPKNPDELYNAVPNRHTNRAAYDSDRPVPAELLREAIGHVTSKEVNITLLTSPSAKQAFAEGTVRATEAIIDDRLMSHDSHHWFRMDRKTMDQHRDGVTLEGAGLSPLLLRLAKLMPTVSAAASDQIWLSNTRDKQLPTAQVFGFVLVEDLYGQAATLRAGQAWQRLHLWATTKGLALQPMNQLVERVDRERQLGQQPATAQALARLVGKPGWLPTFAFRMGYPLHEALPVPRRSVDDVLLKKRT